MAVSAMSLHLHKQHRTRQTNWLRSGGFRCVRLLTPRFVLLCCQQPLNMPPHNTQTQLSPKNTIVGEFRGNKRTAQLFKDWLRTESEFSSEVTHVAVHDYADTKIRYVATCCCVNLHSPGMLSRSLFLTLATHTHRYHFSHFKIVSPERVTCFETEPHVCSDNAASSSPQAAAATQPDAKQEL